MSDEEPKPESSSPSNNTSLDPKVSAMLAYLLGVVGGVIFYAISKDSYVRFHAMQSIFLSIAMAVVYIGFWIISFIIPFLFMLSWLVSLAFFALWVMLMIKAYQGERFKLPVLGQMAEKYSK